MHPPTAQAWLEPSWHRAANVVRRLRGLARSYVELLTLRPCTWPGA